MNVIIRSMSKYYYSEYWNFCTLCPRTYRISKDIRNIYYWQCSMSWKQKWFQLSCFVVSVWKVTAKCSTQTIYTGYNVFTTITAKIMVFCVLSACSPVSKCQFLKWTYIFSVGYRDFVILSCFHFCYIFINSRLKYNMLVICCSCET
jgi:hypothetical protein